jgi:hypothetical protein
MGSPRMNYPPYRGSTAGPRTIVLLKILASAWGALRMGGQLLPLPRFRTIQVRPKDFPAALRQAEGEEDRPQGLRRRQGDRIPSSRTRGACKPGETRLHPSARPIAGVIVKPL